MSGGREPNESSHQRRTRRFLLIVEFCAAREPYRYDRSRICAEAQRSSIWTISVMSAPAGP